MDTTPAAPPQFDIVQLQAGEVLQAFSDPRFRTAWDCLYDACPWATVFQSAAFAAVWYESYSSRYEPLILYAQGSDGELEGILAVAVDRDRRWIVRCGFPQSEYGVWLARPGSGRDFLLHALRTLWRIHPSGRLYFEFVPPHTPVDFLSGGEREFQNSFLVAHPCPVREITAESVRDSLHKKSNKSRLNRLQHVNPVELAFIETRKDLEPHLPAIAALCDLRQGAMNGSLPFQEDRNKAEFFLRLIDTPGLLHAALLLVGGEVAACHLGFLSKNQVHLGLLAHSPFLARHSPGKILLLLSMARLLDQGVDRFDLTPGGDYKERFQNSYDTAYTLALFARGRDARLYGARLWLRARAKGLLLRFDFDPQRVSRKVAQMRARIAASRAVPQIAGMIRRRLHAFEETRFYVIDAAHHATSAFGPDIRFAVNRIEDLLLYAPAEPGDRSIPAFLHDCSLRLEAGETVYTVVDSGKLVHYSWLTRREGFTPNGFGGTVGFPPASYVLWDDYTLPSARGRGLHKASIRARVEGAVCAGASSIFINVEASNRPSRRNIEKFGFVYFGSLFRRVLFGKSRVWSQVAPGTTTCPPGFFGQL
jgi:CelD/BcsL family acetyltransferase involved in cellulose biosynthesis